MTNNAIRRQLHAYIDNANDRKVKAIFTILESDIELTNENSYNKWDDPAFVAMIERRTNALEDGTDKGYTWEEVKRRARQSARAKTKRKL